MNLGKATMKYDGLVVFIRNDSAEIWGFRYGLTLVIGTPKIMASTCVFIRIVSAPKRPITGFSLAPCMVLIHLNSGKATATRRWVQS
jgi:hypothetical protein